MTETAARTLVANSVVGLTRFIVKKNHISKDRAYMKLYRTELFGLLENLDTGLYLEPNERLIDLLKVEMEEGREMLYSRLAKM